MECFIRKDSEGYVVTEACTGLTLLSDSTKSKAIRKTAEAIQRNNERLSKNIDSFIEKNGISPLYG